jgi:hypothetical protein
MGSLFHARQLLLRIIWGACNVTSELFPRRDNILRTNTFLSVETLLSRHERPVQLLIKTDT